MLNDTTVVLRDRLDLLLRNGRQGLLLVLITLALLMNLRLSFWVAAGLPVSMLGTMIILPWIGVTINALSLFGLILVIGILVDDAIVVGENVYAHLEQGKTPTQAAIDGAAEVLPAVLAAVLTTMVAFSPLFFLGGLTGKFIYSIPAVVIAALFLSLIESLLILPPHLAHSLKARDSVEHKSSKLRDILDRGFQWINGHLYAGSLRVILNNRWAVVAASLGIFMMTIGMMRGGIVKFVFFPKIEADRLVARFTMPSGTPREKTQELAVRIEKAAQRVGAALKKKYDQEAIIYTSYWLGRTTLEQPGFSPPTGDEVAEVKLELLPGERRRVTNDEVIRRWRKEVGPTDETRNISFAAATLGPLGRPLEINVLSNDQPQLEQATNMLKSQLSSFSGVFDVEDDMTPGKRELRFELKPLARSLGITLQQLAFQVRNRIYGQEVMRLQRGREEVRVFVRYPLANRKSLRDLRRLWIRTPNGEMPLHKLASWNTQRDLKVVRRVERKRIAIITAELDEAKANRQDIASSLKKSLPKLRKVAPAAQVVFEGQGRQQAETFGSLAIVFPLSLLLIFVILVFVFESYVQSAIVMAMIPFGLIGAVFGHLVMGIPLTILSMFGIVGLAGVVVNDSLVLMDVINRNLKEGMDPLEAAWHGGQRRLRPILSTTLTTFVGLMPLVFEKSLQAQFLIPMGVSLA
ncbi:MAG: efflux RND transporter permease subunit, partial [Myxococcota bacterium]